MGIKFNSGYGAIICDRCRTMICSGFAPNLHYDFRTKKEDHIVRKTKAGNEVHYCSKRCQELHEGGSPGASDNPGDATGGDAR